MKNVHMKESTTVYFMFTFDKLNFVTDLKSYVDEKIASILKLYNVELVGLLKVGS